MPDLRLIALVLAVGLGWAGVVRADVIHVDAANCPGPGDGSRDDPFCTIRAAIEAGELEAFAQAFYEQQSRGV